MQVSELALEPCKVPEGITQGDMGSLLAAHVQDMQALAECAAKHSTLSRTIIQAQGKNVAQ